VVLGSIPYSELSRELPEVWSEFLPFLHYPSDSTPRWSNTREIRQSGHSLFFVHTGRPLESLPHGVLRTLHELNLAVPVLPKDVHPQNLVELAHRLQATINQNAFEAHGPTPGGEIVLPSH